MTLGRNCSDINKEHGRSAGGSVHSKSAKLRAFYQTRQAFCATIGCPALQPQAF
jgi:hypothetical protein